MSKGKKKTTRKFHVGKNVKNDDYNTPMTGAPNTNLDTYFKDSGKIYQRRKYDSDGNAYVDMDAAHPWVDYDHSHDIKDKKRSNEHRRMTKKEQREFNKAKRKRRFWKK